MNGGLLDGIIVLDLTRILSGPYSTMLLADMGSDVIKIEEPLKGDDSRRFGTFVGGESAYFMNFNRNKKGITLNLKSEEGREIFLKLVKKAHIVVENFRPGVMEQFGLGYEELKKANPQIIYACVSGFGQYGPYRDRPAYDIIGQAIGGMMGITGPAGDIPFRTGTSSADVMGGLGLTIGILGALVNKERKGEGEMIDVSMVDAIVSSLQVVSQIYLASGRIPGRKGNQYENTYPCDSFRTSDGIVVIACANDKLFNRLTVVIGYPDLIKNLKFSTNLNRMNNATELKEIIEKWTQVRTSEEVEKILIENEVPVAQVNSIDKIVADPHIADAREMFVEMEHPNIGKMKITGNHLKFTNHKVQFLKPAPTLGEDNYEIYSKFLGFTFSEIDELKKRGII